jgi:hypothetical protein
MTFLLDVNVLIALIDPAHVQQGLHLIPCSDINDAK